METSSLIDDQSALVFDSANDGLSGTCKFVIKGRDSQIIVDSQVKIHNLHIEVHGNNSLVLISAGNKLEKVKLISRGDNSKITIGRDSNLRKFEASIREGNRSIAIGDNCLFSVGIEIRTHDSHKIFDIETGDRINSPEDVVIGDRVWIGQDALILKGARIGSGSVIGIRSVVTGPVPSNSIAVGVPARVVREGVRWSV